LAHNAILKTLFGEKSQMDITNKPLPFKPETRFHMLQAGNNLGFQLAFNLGFAMSFVAAFYIIVYIKERASKAKLLQYVSGVNVVVYWVTAFIWDYITFVVTALICLLTLLAFQESGWASFDELGRTFVVLLCFGWAVLPILYLASMMFSVPATGFTRMSIFFIFTGKNDCSKS
jgi:ATP-binding cassette, subfamily A (ABC1), member 3